MWVMSFTIGRLVSGRCWTGRLQVRALNHGVVLIRPKATQASSSTTIDEESDVGGGAAAASVGIETTRIQRLFLQIGSSAAAILDPHRHDMIACYGETSGADALAAVLRKMDASDEGSRILRDRPRINSTAVDLNALGRMPDDTFGYAYKKFLDDNNVTPDSRMPVKFLTDERLAYAMTRYRESHDLIHTVLGMPTNMLGEVTVKWIEALNIGLPMCYSGAVFGALRLRPKQRKLYSEHYLPWALTTGKQLKPLMNVYWEQRWQQNIHELRHELGIDIINVWVNAIRPTNINGENMPVKE